MTNREKYAEQIIDMAANDIKITVDKEGRLSDCFAIVMIAHGAVATTAEKNLGNG